jgi:hypothetical protein
MSKLKLISKRAAKAENFEMIFQEPRTGSLDVTALGTLNIDLFLTGFRKYGVFGFSRKGE